MRNIVNKRLERIVRRPDYLRTARTKSNAVTPGLILQSAPLGVNAIGHGPRIGFTVSKKVGNAVARNRARRRLKSIARDVFEPESKEPLDFVLIGRVNTLKRSYDDLLDDLRFALKQIRNRQLVDKLRTKNE
jgi:ribonuclease P protein component